MKYFSIKELCKSTTATARGISNEPNEEQRENLVALIEKVLDPCREAFGAPISVSSGFRSPALNSRIGGVKGSQHCDGEAADLVSGAGVEANFRIARIIAQNGTYDQLIVEDVKKGTMLPTWVHVSYKKDGHNRHQLLKKIKGKKGYYAITLKDLGL